MLLEVTLERTQGVGRNRAGAYFSAREGATRGHFGKDKAGGSFSALGSPMHKAGGSWERTRRGYLGQVVLGVSRQERQWVEIAEPGSPQGQCKACGFQEG